MRLELDEWAELSRSVRRALLQVFAGGSLRSASEPTINALRALNLVSQEDELTVRGLNVVLAVARSDHQRRLAA